jgi:hypothetical protein
VLWYARGHADACVGEAVGGDHVAARALAASPWLRTVSNVISSEWGRSRTWWLGLDWRGEEEGMVVTMVIDMAVSLVFWCKSLVSGSLAWSSGVR